MLIIIFFTKIKVKILENVIKAYSFVTASFHILYNKCRLFLVLLYYFPTKVVKDTYTNFPFYIIYF